MTTEQLRLLETLIRASRIALHERAASTTYNKEIRNEVISNLIWDVYNDLDQEFRAKRRAV